MSTMNEAALDAVALVREFDGAPLPEKLRAVGLDPDAAIALAEDYWRESHTLMTIGDFANCFCAGLITGAVLAR